MKLIGMISVIALAGCMDEAVDVELEATPKLGLNGLLPSQLLNATLDPTILDQANLDEMASTPDGFVALRYVVACALGPGQGVVANYTDDAGNPAQQSYGGSFGLATTWMTAGLTVAQQRLVSSCALSLANSTGANITISLRGPNAALATTQQELSGYQLQEGAFFGNVFAGGEGAIACKGSGNSTLSGRVCAKQQGTGSTTQCGYAYAGTCASKCTLSSGYFINCSHNGIGYTSPITTFLTN
jgi:hypothetical protein